MMCSSRSLLATMTAFGNPAPSRIFLASTLSQASVVSHKRLELFFLCFAHSGTSAAGFNPLQGLLASA
jgi:hypothetical protein